MTQSGTHPGVLVVVDLVLEAGATVAAAALVAAGAGGQFFIMHDLEFF